MKKLLNNTYFIYEVNALFTFPIQICSDNNEPLKQNDTIGNITRIASYYEFNNKYQSEFSKPFLNLINNFDFVLKIYLFDVINSFQYKDYRPLSDNFSWYNTRLLGLNDTKASQLLLDYKFLIYPEILPSHTLSKKDLQEICTLENIDVKKSFSRAKIVECLYSELDIGTISKYIKKYGIVCINEYFKQDILFLKERFLVNRKLAMQIYTTMIQKNFRG